MLFHDCGVYSSAQQSCKHHAPHPKSVNVQELAARIVQELSWDTEQRQPDDTVADQIRNENFELLVGLHNPIKPGAVWACLANLVGYKENYKWLYGKSIGKKLENLLSPAVDSTVNKDTAKFLANLKDGYWLLDPHMEGIRKAVQRRLSEISSGSSPMDADEERFLREADENMKKHNY